MRKRRACFLPGRDLKRALCSGHGSPVRRNRRRSDHRLEKKRFREVSAYSTVFRGGGQKAGWGNPRCRIRYRLKSRVRMSPWFRKTYYLPLTPRLHAASISSYLPKFSPPLPNIVDVRQPAPRSSVSPHRPVRWPRVPVAIVVGWCVSLLFEALQQMSATPEKFRHRTTTLISL